MGSPRRGNDVVALLEERGRAGAGVLVFSDGREFFGIPSLVRGDGGMLERIIERGDAPVDLLLVGERHARLLNGGLIVVDYPLVEWSGVLNRGIHGGTHSELIGLLFQHHLRVFRAT